MTPPESRPPAFLIIGGDGLIGDALVRKIRAESCTVLATSRRPATNDPDTLQFNLAGNTKDLFLDARIPALQKCGPLITFLAAAVTKIAECARDPQGSRLINVTNTITLARELLTSGSAVIFLSSNAVFSGNVPYPTDLTLPYPVTDYGRQKAEVEKALLAMHASIPEAPPLMIVRLTKVVARTSPLIGSWIENLQAGLPIDAFRDRRLSPISLRHTVDSLLKIAKSGKSGIYHVTGSCDLSYYDFARLLAEFLGVDADLVKPVAADANVSGLVQKNGALGQTRAGSALSLMPEEPAAAVTSLLS